MEELEDMNIPDDVWRTPPTSNLFPSHEEDVNNQMMPFMNQGALLVEWGRQLVLQEQWLRIRKEQQEQRNRYNPMIANQSVASKQDQETQMEPKRPKVDLGMEKIDKSTKEDPKAADQLKNQKKCDIRCEICGRSFKRRTAYKTHYLKHSRILGCEREKCCYTTDCWRSMKGHLKASGACPREWNHCTMLPRLIHIECGCGQVITKLSLSRKRMNINLEELHPKCVFFEAFVEDMKQVSNKNFDQKILLGQKDSEADVLEYLHNNISKEGAQKRWMSERTFAAGSRRTFDGKAQKPYYVSLEIGPTNRVMKYTCRK